VIAGCGPQLTEARRIVPTRFGQMHLRRVMPPAPAGARAVGDVPLVLLHMSPRSSEMWARLQRALPRTTVAPDRLGYGFSDPPPRALSMVEYAMAVLDALDGWDVGDRFDVLGMHTGCLEALELAHLVPQRVRHLGMIAIPIFDGPERAAGVERLGRMSVEPRENGQHLLDAWQARFAFREPPFDLADVQRRFVDYLLAGPTPGQAYHAVFGYDAAESLARLRRPIVAFAPRDDVYEVTVRSRALLPPGSTYVDLPGWNIDFLRTHTAEFVKHLERHVPA
jgi:pimeloyl-ACP methyl ester carboxylesterase